MCLMGYMLCSFGSRCKGNKPSHNDQINKPKFYMFLFEDRATRTLKRVLQCLAILRYVYV